MLLDLDNIIDLYFSYLAKLELLSCKEQGKIKSYSRKMHPEILFDKHMCKDEIIHRISAGCMLIQRDFQRIENFNKIKIEKIQDILVWLAYRDQLTPYDEVDLCAIPLILSLGSSTIDFDDYFRKYVFAIIPQLQNEGILNEDELENCLKCQFEFLELEHHYLGTDGFIIEQNAVPSYVSENVVQGFFRIRHILQHLYPRNNDIVEYVYRLLTSVIPSDAKRSITEGLSFVEMDYIKEIIIEKRNKKHGKNQSIQHKEEVLDGFNPKVF